MVCDQMGCQLCVVKLRALIVDGKNKCWGPRVRSPLCLFPVTQRPSQHLLKGLWGQEKAHSMSSAQFYFYFFTKLVLLNFLMFIFQFLAFSIDFLCMKYWTFYTFSLFLDTSSVIFSWIFVNRSYGLIRGYICPLLHLLSVL